MQGMTSQAAHRASELKEAFTRLKRDQNELLTLFKSVSGSLDACPGVGENHSLAKQWQEIRQEYRERMQTSQRNACKLASLISQYSLSLPLILESNTSLEVKKDIVDMFIKEATNGQEVAKENTKAFDGFSERLASFPNEVKKCNKASDTWQLHLWNTLKSLCRQALHIINRITQWPINTLLVKIGHIRLCIGPFMAEYTPLIPKGDKETPRPASAALLENQINDDCSDIREHVRDVTHIWTEIRLSFDELHRILGTAGSLSTSPTYCEIYVQQAEEVYTPLVEGLRAYANNRRPDFGGSM